MNDRPRGLPGPSMPLPLELMLAQCFVARRGILDPASQPRVVPPGEAGAAPAETDKHGPQSPPEPTQR